MQDVPYRLAYLISNTRENRFSVCERNRKKSHGNKLIFSGSLAFCIPWCVSVSKSVAFAYRVAIQNIFFFLSLNDDDSLSQQLILFVIPFFAFSSESLS